MALDFDESPVRDWMVTSVPVITPKTTVATALRLLREHGIPALPVWGEGRLLGLVDEKDLLRYTPSEMTTLDVYELREVLDKMTVARIASPSRASVTPDAPLREAARLMLKAQSAVVPVLDGERLLGIVTWASLAAAAAAAPLAGGDRSAPGSLVERTADRGKADDLEH